MDGITALSLAVNIIQVVFWGRQVIDVLKGGEIYQTQRDATTNFQSATGSLQKQLSLQPQPITAEDQSLLQIAQTCETAADKLLKELEPTDNANRLKLAMKAPFKGPSIKKLEEELAFCQRVLETQLLVGMRNNIDLTALRMDQNFDNLSDGVQNLALKMEDGKTELIQILDDYHKSMVRLENQSANIVSAMSDFQLGVSSQRLAYNQTHFQVLLSSLFFPRMFSRRDQIPFSYPETYKWALMSHRELIQKQHKMGENANLLEWLQHSDGLYWISGKAGSGKSTFMKFIIEDVRTEIALSLWSGPGKLLIIGTHFFWSQGNELQRSQGGFLQAILYQILSACPGLAGFSGTELHAEQHEWTKTRLIQALYAILLQSQVPLKICLFVDGLDESMENPTELLDLLCEISSKGNLKCVIASRPWAVFHKRLTSYPHIYLHELTEDDIRRFVDGKIQNMSSTAPLLDEETWNITQSLVRKAEGVFLWVSLATASILDGIESGDDYNELQSRINELPTKLKELYGTIISRIEQRYRTQAMRVFKLLLLTPPHHSLRPTVLSMSLVDLGEKGQPPRTSSNEVVNLELVMRECNRTFLRLQQRCGGLLHFEFQDHYGQPAKTGRGNFPKQLHSLEEAFSLRVQFLHRTVFDFFHESPEVLDISTTGASYPWDPLAARAETYIRIAEITLQGGQISSKSTRLTSTSSCIATALLSIRCVELERHTAQGAMLERLDIQGRDLLHVLGEEKGFAPESHWCILFSPAEYRSSVGLGSGNMNSLTELCAYSGLVQTALAELPKLSPESCTAFLNCTLNGLTYARDGHFQKKGSPQVNTDVLTPSACVDDDKFAIKDFQARAALISEILQRGGCPNTEMVCVVRELDSSGVSSGLQRVHKRFTAGETAWCHLLKMLTADFYWSFCPSHGRRLLHNMETIASWADLIQGFIHHHANPRQQVQNLKHSIRFDPLGLKRGPDAFQVTFDFESEPLPIITSYFQSDTRGQTLLNTMRQKGGGSKVQFKTVRLKAHSEFREIFTDIFGVDEPSNIANGTVWDVSNGVLDHLGTRILTSNQPLWDTHYNTKEPNMSEIIHLRFDPWGKTRFDPWDVALQKKTQPHTLEVLKEVFTILNKFEPNEKLDHDVLSRARAHGITLQRPTGESQQIQVSGEPFHYCGAF